MSTFFDWIVTTHVLFGERVLPILILAAAVWFTVTWKPDVEAKRTPAGRIFPLLVTLQFVIGLIQWVYGLAIGRSDYLGFPFILHPILGFVAVLVAYWVVGSRTAGNPTSRLGRWGPLAASVLLLVIVTGSIITGMAR